MTTALITLMVLLFTKHFVVDFLLQFPWHYNNKSKYGHPGGISHAFSHCLFTGMSLILVSLVFTIHWGFFLILFLAMLDGVLHYHIDWAKVKIKEHFGWGPTTHEEFWILTGFDQYLHALTYIAIIVILFL